MTDDFDPALEGRLFAIELAFATLLAGAAKVDPGFLGRMHGTHYPWPHPRPRVHSRKPEGSYQLCERVSPGPHLEMYARYRREGWQQRGDQLEAV